MKIEISRVLVIYTGGTIGMRNAPEHGYIPVFLLPKTVNFYSHGLGVQLFRKKIGKHASIP